MAAGEAWHCMLKFELVAFRGDPLKGRWWAGGDPVEVVVG